MSNHEYRMKNKFDVLQQMIEAYAVARAEHVAVVLANNRGTTCDKSIEKSETHVEAAKAKLDQHIAMMRS